MKEDFSGIEAELYQAIADLYSPGWDPESDLAVQKKVIDLLKSINLNEHAAFFYKATKINKSDEVTATPLEHLIFAAVGYQKNTVKAFSENVRPEPLEFVLDNWKEIDPAKLASIEDTLYTALDRLAKHDFVAFKQERGIRSLDKIKAGLEKLSLGLIQTLMDDSINVTPANFDEDSNEDDYICPSDLTDGAERDLEKAASPVRAASPARAASPVKNTTPELEPEKAFLPRYLMEQKIGEIEKLVTEQLKDDVEETSDTKKRSLANI